MKLTEVEKAERALARRIAERDEVKRAVQAITPIPGLQHPLKYEAEQADRAVWSAETRLARARRNHFVANVHRADCGRSITFDVPCSCGVEKGA